MDDDPLKVYLSELHKIPSMTRGEEIDCVKHVWAGGQPIATVAIGGIELEEKVKKGQFNLSKLGGRTATIPEIWRAALAA